MIVDLVRNDLSQTATKGSVEVEELCEIYSFETVHQMISTVTCEAKESISFTDIFFIPKPHSLSLTTKTQLC